MTFPVVQATAVTHYSANQTSHLINLPAGIAAGDLLLLWFCVDSEETVTTPAGWTIAAGPLDNVDTSVLYKKIASGSEGSTVTIVTDSSESSSAVAYRISGVTAEVYSGSVPTDSIANGPTPTASASADSLVVTFGSTLGGGTITDIQNGPATAVIGNGNPATSSSTVAAVSYYKHDCTQSGVAVFPFVWLYSTSLDQRMVTAVLHGTASGGGGSAFSLSRVVNRGV